MVAQEGVVGEGAGIGELAQAEGIGLRLLVFGNGDGVERAAEAGGEVHGKVAGRARAVGRARRGRAVEDVAADLVARLEFAHQAPRAAIERADGDLRAVVPGSEPAGVESRRGSLDENVRGGGDRLAGLVGGEAGGGLLEDAAA